MIGRLADFEGYKVFLDHLAPLAELLREYFEVLARRRDTRCLGIYGPQSSGKTLFARKLADDFSRAKDAIRKGELVPTADNVWHRTTGGTSLDRELISSATLNTEILLIEDDKEWLKTTADWLESHKDRHCVVLADNAESSYLLQGLVSLNDGEFLNLGSHDVTLRLAAERLVRACRTSLRGCLIVMFMNDEEYLDGFAEAVEKQHRGLMSTADMPKPSARDKETIIRVNTNRLNDLSYWACADRAGPAEKIALYEALSGDTMFSGSFTAVEAARRSRQGRPARKCFLTLVAFVDDAQPRSALVQGLGGVDRVEAEHDCLSLIRFKKGWTAGSVESPRDAALLESEWQLRVCLLGTRFLEALLSGQAQAEAAALAVLRVLEEALGPGSHNKTRRAQATRLEALLDALPAQGSLGTDLGPFWRRGQGRYREYEAVLNRLYNGDYDITGPGYRGYRPDYIVSEFRPCRLLDSPDNQIGNLNSAVKREGHVLEYTSIQAVDAARVATYLKTKLSNYVEIVREQ